MSIFRSRFRNQPLIELHRAVDLFLCRMAILLTAADADPTNSDAQISLARVHYAMKHADNALKAYEKALQLGAKRDTSLEKMLNALKSGSSEK